MVAHSALTGADLHEPKGAAAASSGQVYVANGAGSGAFQKIGLSELDTTEILVPNRYCLTGIIADVSTASSILIPVPLGSTMVSATLVLGGTIASADASVTFEKPSTVSLGSAVTVAFSGSAEGTTFTFLATTNTSLTAGQYIKVSTDGGSTNTVPLYITIVLDKA